MIIAPITAFMLCAIFGLLFGLLYHYLWIKNPDLKVIYIAGIGILFGTFFGLTTNLPPLSRAKTLVLSLILGFVYAIALFGIHLRYEGYEGDGIKGIQISILKLIKYKKIAKFEELDEELKIGIDVLNEMEKSGLILLDYKNRYKLTDLGNIMLGRSEGEGDGEGEGETKEGGVLYFILISYAISIIIALAIYFMGGLGPISGSLLLPLMFAPLLASVIVIKFLTHERFSYFGLTIGKFRYYIYALIYPFAVLGIGILFLFLFRFPISFENLMEIEISLLLLFAAPFINFILAFGEEFGWRGFLQDRLIKKYGMSIGIILVGLIWGFWHAPIILLGYNYPHHPLIGVFLFPVICVLLGFFLSWLRIKSDSVFPCALAHGAFNAYAGFGFLVSPGDELFTLPTGLIAIPGYAIIAIIVYLNLNRIK